MQNIVFGQYPEIGHIHEEVTYHDHRNSNYYRKRKVPVRVLQFLSQKVELIPAVVGEEPLIESQRQLENICLTTFESTSQGLSAAHENFDDAN